MKDFVFPSNIVFDMFAKVFGQIFDSSIAEDYNCRRMFIDLLVLADSDGVVDMTQEAISRRTNVPIEQVCKYIDQLQQPDLLSRSKKENGRRLIAIDPERGWGWQVVNYRHYRQIRDEEARRSYFRDAKRKQRKKSVKDLMVDTGGDCQIVPSASASKSASACTQKEVEDFCESLSLPRSDGEAMFLHWQEKGPAKVKDWKATIRKWKSFGYLPSQKIRPDRNGKGPVVPTQTRKPQPEGWEAWRLETYPESKERDFWRVPGDVQSEFNQQRKQMKGTV